MTDTLQHPLPPDGGISRYFGLYPAIVSDIVDPQNLGRIQVMLPWLGDAGKAMRAWATLLTPYADDDQGLCILPEVDTQVVVGFEAGDPRRPYIVGSAWNGKEKLPFAVDAQNNKRVIKTREGTLLEFDDTKGAPKVTLSTASGHKLCLDDGAQEVTLQHSSGVTVRLNAAGQVEVLANSSVEITAPTVNVHAATANFDGMVTCTTLIANTGVVSPSYTPGAGNVW
jgi:uncharacterized protein involved in type VI secretion and phage assembly